MENVQSTDEDTISLFVPMQIKRQRRVVMIIAPKHLRDNNDERFYDEKMIRAFAKAYQWRGWLQEGKAANLAEIARQENIDKTYLSDIYQLNWVAPHIVEAIVNGRQPRSLCLQDFLRKPIPRLWQEQLEVFGFTV